MSRECKNCAHYRSVIFDTEKQGACLHHLQPADDNSTCGSFHANAKERQAEERRASRAAFERLCFGVPMLGKIVG